MTNKQKQHLLAYLGYYTGEIDGKWGGQSKDATARFQEDYDLDPDGIFGKLTEAKILEVIGSGVTAPKQQEAALGDFWDDIEYFTREELRCKCGGRYCNGFPAEPQEMAVRLADRARKYFGRPAQNVSFLRCSTWNAISGGVANSQHMYGEAMDICIPGVSADRLYGFLKKQPEVRYTYKINNTNVHFDIPKGVR